MPICLYCQREFVPSKYRWRVQKVCTDATCRKQRQQSSLQAWRDRNPYYYKIKREDPAWRAASCQRARVWRNKNTGRIRAYREQHMDQYRTYMRLYMRRYRQDDEVMAEPPANPKGKSAHGKAV